MITRVKMPEVNVTSSEVTLISWRKQVGEKVKRGDILVTIESEKATMDVEAFVDGYLREIYFDEDQTVPTDAIIAIISTTPDEPLELDFDSDPAPAADDQVSEEPLTRDNRLQDDEQQRIIASPIAKKIAAENQINLAAVQGTGPNGRITREDVEAALLSGQESAVEAAQLADEQPLSGMRKAIAEKTVLSKSTIPHYYLSIEIDMERALALIAARKTSTEDTNQPVPTLTDLILWSCGQVLPSHPYLNASWKNGRIELINEVNIGLVIGLDQGLMVPVVRKANSLTIEETAQRTTSLKSKALAGNLGLQELTGGTFTISNLGMFGISSFIAVIQPPESAILALGSTTKKLVVGEDEAISIRPMLTAILSADHRVVDGVAAARFLNNLKDTLETLD